MPHRFWELFSRSSVGVFGIDGKGQCSPINDRAEVLLSSSDGLQLRKGLCLEAVYQSDDRKLREIINQTLKRATSRDQTGARVLTVTRQSGRHFHVVVFPVSAAIREFYGCVEHAVVFVHDADRKLDSFAENLMNLYNMTPAEIRLSLSICQGRTIAETASVIGISELTVKTHLKSIFSKTGVRRQAELVSLLSPVTSLLDMFEWFQD